MTEVPNNLNAPRDLLERALGSKKGIRIWCTSRANALSLRNRLSTVKTAERKKTTRLYPMDSPLYNKCPYDDLSVVLKDGVLSVGDEVRALTGLPPEEVLNGTWLYILPIGEGQRGFVVEELE